MSARFPPDWRQRKKVKPNRFAPNISWDRSRRLSRRFRTIKELTRNGERRTENSLGDRETFILLGNRTKAEENQRKVKERVGASQASI